MDEDPIFSESFEWWDKNAREWQLVAEGLMSGRTHAATDVEKLAQLTEVLADGAAFWGIETAGLNRLAARLAEPYVANHLESLLRPIDTDLKSAWSALSTAKSELTFEASLDWLLQFDAMLNGVASYRADGQALGGCYERAREAVQALSTHLTLEKRSGFAGPREKALAARDVDAMLQCRLQLGIAVRRKTSGWQERRALSGEHAGSPNRELSESFVLFRGENSRAVLDGEIYDLTAEQARILQLLAEAGGSLVGADRLRKHRGSDEDPGKTIKRMPKAIQDLIESRPGQSGGRRLTRIPRIIHEPKRG